MMINPNCVQYQQLQRSSQEARRAVERAQADLDSALKWNGAETIFNALGIAWSVFSIPTAALSLIEKAIIKATALGLYSYTSDLRSYSSQIRTAEVYLNKALMTETKINQMLKDHDCNRHS